MATDRRREGYLLISDLSGYTAFLTGTELEHAQQIVEELTQVQLDQMPAPARLVKLEGDAIFWEVPAQVGAERVLELTQKIYSAFTDHVFDASKSTTCACAACKSLPTLDLKLFVHFGEYLIHRAAGIEDLAGPSVIAIHRMMKNEIAEKFGLRAYVWATRAVLDRTPRAPALPSHQETYEHLGAVEGGVLDLRQAHKAHRDQHREYVSAEEADIAVSVELDAPPAVVWDLMFDPHKRATWETQLKVSVTPREDGTLGSGATLHCAHDTGAITMRFLDWRPFQYATMDVSGAGTMKVPPSRTTQEFFPTETGTRMDYRMSFARAPLMTRVMMKVVGGFARKFVAKQFVPLVEAARKEGEALRARNAMMDDERPEAVARVS